ncbi:MAG TPA: hydantoinase/oxoprolinase family protein [Micropepsaceae bacterium]|nr:hydantoinase/oxoprolinase family protein [Micropepsaceae bacterium]
MTAAPKLRLAADIGGTFTDIAAFDETSGRLMLGKALSTPAALVAGIEAGVAKAETTFADAGLFLHGSTVAINALLERTGAKTALLITEGFRDIYEIGRVNRPDSYNLFFKKHRPLVPREHRYEVKERLYASGEVLKPLDEAEIVALARELKKEKIEAAAILFLHCYRNAEHELKAKAILERELPGVFVTASHELSQEYREFERSSTVAANAYIGPKVDRYLSEIDTHLERTGFDGAFLVVQSTGGLFEAHQARKECVRMLESGPASGVVATQAICRELEIPNAIAFDMGGTTAKAGVIFNHHVLTTGAALIGEYAEALPIQLSTIDIFEVGTGGGSIARVERSGALHVGPESAGAMPGPACYGQGGIEATITDANLVLGRLGADRFLGGEMKLDVKAAEKTLYGQVAQKLKMNLIDAAEGVIEIAVTKMAYAVKAVTTERGLDVGNFVLVAYGGAGPLHATAVARELGITRVLIPRAPGHFSACGMLFSDLRYDYVRTWFTSLANLDFDRFETIFAELEDDGRRAIAAAGVKPKEIAVGRALDMRYVGQEHLVTIDVPIEHFAGKDRGAIKRLFDGEHERRYGTSAPGEPAEIASLRTWVTGVLEKPKFERIARGPEAPSPAASRGTRQARFGEVFVAAPVYDRAQLVARNRIKGPALIEEHASTTVLMPGDRCEVDALGNLAIEVGSA